MQEHYHWAKVQNLWDHYVKKQKEMLSTEDYELRVEEGFYPKEMPEWWRRRYRNRFSNLKSLFLYLLKKIFNLKKSRKYVEIWNLAPTFSYCNARTVIEISKREN